MDWLHFSSDAPLLINALLFFPEFNQEKTGFGRTESVVSLHCRKVLIDEVPKGLLPEWLRFLKGIVDSADLPLNISRETMQDSALVQKLNRVLTKRIIKHLEDLAKRDAEGYEKFWREFNLYIKEGIVTDHANREALAPLLRYETSATESGKLASLDAYVDRMKPEQKEIYYLYAPNRITLESGPYLEAFKARGIEVLFLYESADDFVMNHLDAFREKKLVAADQADLDLGGSPEGTGEALFEKRQKGLCQWIKENLGDEKVSAVETGKRLVDSPAVALNADKFMSATMRRMMQAMGQGNPTDATPRVKLEINPRHKLIHQLDTLRDGDPAFARLIAEQILDNALLAAGMLDNPRAMAVRIYEILENAAGKKS